MPYVVDLADSELLVVLRDGTQVSLRLAAAAARSEAGERGWLSGVTLTLADAVVVGDVAHAFGRVAAGALRDGARDLPRLPVPGNFTGDVALALRLANGTQIGVRARALVATLAADARFHDDLSC